MRRLLCSVLLLVSLPATAGDVGDQLEAAEQVAWLGIDYSQVRIFDAEQFEDPEARVYWSPVADLPDVGGRFRNQKEAFLTLATDWNQMAVNALIDPLEKAIQRDIVVDLGSPTGPTAATSRKVWFESQYEARNNPPTMTDKDVAGLVKRYRTATRTGIGLALVADRFDEPDKEACYWVTWVELKKKEVIQTERTCEKRGSADFRAAWYAPGAKVMKTMTKELKKGTY